MHLSSTQDARGGTVCRKTPSARDHAYAKRALTMGACASQPAGGDNKSRAAHKLLAPDEPEPLPGSKCARCGGAGTIQGMRAGEMGSQVIAKQGRYVLSFTLSVPIFVGVLHIKRDMLRLNVRESLVHRPGQHDHVFEVWRQRPGAHAYVKWGMGHQLRLLLQPPMAADALDAALFATLLDAIVATGGARQDAEATVLRLEAREGSAAFALFLVELLTASGTQAAQRGGAASARQLVGLFLKNKIHPRSMSEEDSASAGADWWGSLGPGTRDRLRSAILGMMGAPLGGTLLPAASGRGGAAAGPRRRGAPRRL
jgi:hypothetical protein